MTGIAEETIVTKSPGKTVLLGATAALIAASITAASAQSAPNCPTMRKVNVGVSVSPPNVVHTTPYVAKALGFFAKRCIDASIIQFEGGQSQTANVAAAQGTALVSVSDVAIGRGLKVQQIWGLAPRMPQAYMVPGDIKTAADLKGKRLSATGGGVGGFNWRMGREVLKSANLTVNDAQFIPSPTAGRLPGLVAGQIDGVALHPEDVFLARKQKATLHPLVQLVDLMPNYMFNAYGASLEWIAKDRALLRDTVAAMIEANRAIYKREGQGRADHHAGDQEAEGRGRIRLGDRDQELRLVGQHRLRSQAHAMVDRQQHRQRRHRQGQEADGRTGRQHQARRRGGGSRRRPGDHRQVHGVTIGFMVRNSRSGHSNHEAAHALRDASLRDAPQDEADQTSI